MTISIHVPLAGDDFVFKWLFAALKKFLSTSPLRGTTGVEVGREAAKSISIHVPLAGDDQAPGVRILLEQNFYPRPPCGGRLVDVGLAVLQDNFYPRPPCGGRRLAAALSGLFADDFYPRPPCGGRRKADRASQRRNDNFYPRPPCGGRPRTGARRTRCDGHFYPRPPCGGRHRQRAYREANREFLSTSPLRGTTGLDQIEEALHGISIHVPLAGDDGMATHGGSSGC